MEDIVQFTYVTFPNKEEAVGVVDTLLSERLIACANIFGAESHYMWNGKKESRDEVVVIFKAPAYLKEKLCERVKALHPYDVPCIIAVDVHSLNESFTEWILQSAL